MQCENLDKFFNGRSIDEIEKNELVARILVGNQSDTEVKMVQPVTKVKEDVHLFTQCQNYCQITEEEQLLTTLNYYTNDLKELFVTYASYANPMNT